MRYRDTSRILLLLAGGLLIATSGSAQSLAGLWGSTFYRVQLTVSGTAVTGSFTSLDDPKAPAGKIAGQLQPGGQAFVADWTFATGPETGTFKTWLGLSARNSVLNGYRWSEEAQPTSFALHRAVNGQLVQTVSEDTPIGGTVGGSTGGSTGGTTGGPSGGTITTSPASNVEVIVCETVVNGQPQNVSDQFTAPKSIVTMVRYTNLAPNSAVDWLWTMEGRTEAKLSKTLSGTGWHSHGLRSDTGIVPGSYLVTVSVNGKQIARRTITVRPAGGTAAPANTGSTAGNDASANQPSISVIMCEAAPGGEPQRVGSQFTKPKSLVCLLKYRNLPANTELKWLWQKPSGQTTPYVKTVSGTGWATHGFTSPTGLSPGTWRVTVSANGKVGKTTSVVVK